MAGKDEVRGGESIVLADLSPAERDAVEGLRRVLGCRTRREFARKAGYLKGMVEKGSGSRSGLGVEGGGEGVVLILSPSLDGISQALKEKIILKKLGIPVLGFAMGEGADVSFYEDLLGLGGLMLRRRSG